MVERTNQKVVKFMKLFQSHNHCWESDISLVAFSINMEINRHTSSTTFQFLHDLSILFPSFLTKDSTLLMNNNDLWNVDYK